MYFKDDDFCIAEAVAVPPLDARNELPTHHLPPSFILPFPFFPFFNSVI